VGAGAGEAAERKREGLHPRTGGYVVPAGILHCGHCGGRMYGCTMRPRRGKKVYEYRKYACATANTKPGTCKAYSVDEKVILDTLLDQLENHYLSPERLAGLEAKLTERAEVKHEKAPVQVERLRKRLAEKDAEIQDAARNVLRAKDNIDLLNDQLSEMRKDRAKLAKDLEAAECAVAVPVEKATVNVEEAFQRLWTLRERLLACRDKPAQLGEVLRLLVSRVDLYFEPTQNGKRMWYRFVKGAIKLRPILDVQGCVTSGR
jgi:hypothetical protein